MASRKRSVIWDYFAINPEDERIAICNMYDETITRGGASAKSFNTSNLRYHVRRKHPAKFLGVKEAERSEQNRILSEESLMYISLRWLK